MSKVSECGVGLEGELFKVAWPVPAVVLDGLLLQQSKESSRIEERS